MSFGQVGGLTVFANQPSPDQNTFNAGIPVTSNDGILSIILFSPNLRTLVAVDNLGSGASSHYEQDVTHGFSFSASQGVSISSTLGINIEVVTGSVTTQFSITFTEQWSTQTTEKMTFD